MAEDYIKLHKKMLNWGWYEDINTCRLFIHCLLRANRFPGEWMGIKYNAGEFITSLATLAKETSLSVRQVRVALDHLKLTGELTDLRQSNYRIITVVKWGEYQVSGKPNDKPVTNLRQTCDKPVTTDKEYKSIRDIEYKNNKYICAFDAFWKIYPRKVDKARAYKCYQARLKDGYSEDQLLTACKNYAKSCEENRTEQKYIKHAATFLSVNEPFLDYLKGEEDHGYDSAGDNIDDEERRNREIDEYLASDEYRNNDERPFA